MNDKNMLTAIDGPMLAEAFPVEYRPLSLMAGSAAVRMLAKRQWTERFAVQVEDQRVLIPARLHFASERFPLFTDEDAGSFVRALLTRSNDGFQRQRAARDLLLDLQSWGAPFIVALVGEYVVEILEDISAAMTPEVQQTLADFISHNRAFWNTTKRRVTSYWNVYYRSGRDVNGHRAYRRNEYVGFVIINQLEMAAFGFSEPVGK